MKTDIRIFDVSFESRTYTVTLYRWDDGLVGFDVYKLGIWALHGGGHTHVKDAYKHIISRLRFIEGVYTHLDNTALIFESDVPNRGAL